MREAQSPLPDPEERGIGLENERSLHAAIKEWYSLPGDRFEVRVGGYIIDIVRDDLLIEIQTRNFAAIREKLRTLVESHRVQLVHPIAQEKWIVRIAPSDNRVIGRRKSPKRGKLTGLFDELVRIPDLINNPSFSLVILMVRVDEIRCPDGKGSWRRKGVSIVDTQLGDVVEKVVFMGRHDFLRLIPEGLGKPFSNRGLAEKLGIRLRQARRMTYCLRKMGLIENVGKRGNELLFEIASGS